MFLEDCLFNIYENMEIWKYGEINFYYSINLFG